MTTLWATIFVLGILVFVHELGHFLVAKWSGIRVERFSLGFPPKLIGKKIGETEYCISWVPLGGYVKMAGENPEETLTGEPYEFMSKPVWIRFVVVFAGPLMNFLLAILLFWGILFFNGKQEVHDDITVIGNVAPGSPAEKAGLVPQDKILSVDGIPVKTFRDMAQLIHKKIEAPVSLKWIRNGIIYEASVLTKKDQIFNEEGKPQVVGKIGIGPTSSVIKLNLFRAFAEAILFSLTLCFEILKFVGGLITGALSIKLIGGPIFIAQAAGETARQGFVSLLSFTGLLSVNLALLNLFPIPVLDGGHLVFLALEKLRGRPLSLRQRTAIQKVGLALLLLLVLLVTYNDILRILTNP